MDDSKPAVLASRSKRRFRGAEEKRQIIEEALRPGASVAAVARAHGVNANMLFHWRELYRAGLLLHPEGCGVRLLPVSRPPRTRFAFYHCPLAGLDLLAHSQARQMRKQCVPCRTDA